jgi:hypothetical protein
VEELIPSVVPIQVVLDVSTHTSPSTHSHLVDSLPGGFSVPCF